MRRRKTKKEKKNEGLIETSAKHGTISKVFFFFLRNNTVILFKYVKNIK